MQSFTVEIDPALLADLHARLDRTRWPDEVEGAGWDYGTNLDYLRQLTAYWRNDFDWPAQAAALNRYPHYLLDSAWGKVHVQIAAGQGPAPAPLLLLHGWPSSFVQMQRILPLLSDPASHGGDPADSFTVVAASLPGYGFSDRPTLPGMSVARVAATLHEVITTGLGYRRYAVRGTVLGAGVAMQLALTMLDALLGVHTGAQTPGWGRFRMTYHRRRRRLWRTRNSGRKPRWPTRWSNRAGHRPWPTA
jgi:microsomal epoxide hydrolase